MLYPRRIRAVGGVTVVSELTLIAAMILHDGEIEAASGIDDRFFRRVATGPTVRATRRDRRRSLHGVGTVPDEGHGPIGVHQHAV